MSAPNPENIISHMWIDRPNIKRLFHKIYIKVRTTEKLNFSWEVFILYQHFLEVLELCINKNRNLQKIFVMKLQWNTGFLKGEKMALGFNSKKLRCKKSFQMATDFS